jgi:aspartokinase-like uncharacterized kinase
MTKDQKEQFIELLKDIREHSWSITTNKVSKKDRYANLGGILLCTDAIIGLFELDKKEVLCEIEKSIPELNLENN